MMPMLHRSRAKQKVGRKIRLETEGQDAVFLFGQEFCGELEELTKGEKYESNPHYIKDFINESTRPFPKFLLSLLDFPVSASEPSAFITLMRCKDLVQHKEQFQVQQ
jgi:hypothetical protein